jgi:hypothetical protein
VFRIEMRYDVTNSYFYGTRIKNNKKKIYFLILVRYNLYFKKFKPQKKKKKKKKITYLKDIAKSKFQT